MKSRKELLEQTLVIEPLIRTVRGQRVILDSDLATIYGVATKRFNEQVRRNIERFPDDFMFRLTEEEYENLKSQYVTSSETHPEQMNRSQIATGSGLEEQGGMRSQFATASKRNVRHLPYVFTEEGAVMAANILNSPAAVRMSIFVVRAFLKMRSFLADNKEFVSELADLEKKLTERLDTHEVAIVDIIRRLMKLLEPPPPSPPPRKPIGFHVRE
jgi:hypothetical protein